MPNKTLYIRDADLPLWDSAQNELESISSVFVDYLRERLEKKRLESKAKRPKKEKLDMVQAMDELLAEINTAHNLDTERHPSHSPITLAQERDTIGYKLHQRRANPDRVMSLVVDSFSFDNHGRLNPETRNRITAEVVKFWNGKCSDRHTFVDATT